MVRRSGGSPFDGDQFFVALQRAIRWLTRRGGFVRYLFPLLLVGLWMGTGIYVVNPRENGVIRLFGKFESLAEPGLHWRLPTPITSLVLVDVETIRSDQVGFRVDNDGRAMRFSEEALMLTTDNSIVEAQMVVQYRVEDAASFVFKIQDPELVLHTTSEVALRSIVGRTDLVSLLTVGRASVEQQTRGFLQTLLDEYETGILVSDVKLQMVDPPDAVKDAFQEVTRALEDETRLENEAEAYFADQIPRAQGQVQVLIRSAASYQREQIERARGETIRFLSLLAEYRESPSVTRERLYLETLEDVLSRVEKTLIDSDVEIFPFLNVADLNSGIPSLGRSDVNEGIDR